MDFLRKNKKLAVAFFVIPLCLSGFFWKKCFSQEEDLTELKSETWSGQKILDGNYITDEQQMIFIEKGTEIIFTENSSLYIKDSVFQAVGTVKEPIVFRSASGEPNGYHIFVDDSSGLYFKNVDISGGGTINQEELPLLSSLFFKKAQAEQFNFGALTKTGESVFVLDNCYLHNNSIAIKIFNTNLFSRVAVNRSRFFENDISVLAEDNEKFLNFRYNYWENDNVQGLIDDYYSKNEKDFKDPVIIVPGIMGSAEKDGQWLLDPILGTYDDLIRAFEADVYQLDEDLFLFPYQWRDSNTNNALLLKDKIQEIKSLTNSNKVDIVAHSMGGLLTREYLEADDYWSRDDVDQFITLGTPHNGSPESYITWEAGEFIPDLFGIIKKNIFNQEAEEAGYENLFDYIRNRPIESVKELLPTYEYLWDEDFNRYKEYPEEYPRNEFLENLNFEEKIGNLLGAEFINIYGNVGDSSTVAEIKVINEMIGDLWEHGYPDGFEKPLPIGDRGFNLGIGDETVPTVSALFPSSYATYNFEIDSSHGNLPTDAQQDVLEFLTGERPAQKIQENSKIESLLIYLVFSPIDMQIVLEDGRKIGTDPESGEVVNEIEGAYYTGNDTENEFITIPNYSDGKYQILTSGTGDGDFRIEAHSVEVDEQGLVQEDKIEEIQGLATTGESQSFEIQVGEVTEEEEQDDEDSQGDEGEDDSEESEDGEDEEEDEKDDKNNNGRALGHIKQQEKKQEIAENKEQKKQKIEDKKLAQKEAKKNGSLPSQGQAGKTKVAGKSVQKSNPWIIAGMVLVGLIGIFLTWTIGKKDNFIKKYFK
jgi:pimeloyl-ACP methyl ester carboxylesterase